ncbi:hypothetical protein B9Z19DRAFT_1137063 [Tuber borchii]|uniref:Uncharacterized protein n=1 Tax=Tuber borchii TaxID=42251 RepID=A0A2T6ZB02_TUBBO|nr:hypothetical protein B9Z19DRAFT_1138760 [Tuber borchii]PUU72239.1 hypothetical protein B9Z19DRAFT_1138472 [Tuber borchii]PUU72665.1 hypothetical protein B9Z19DRAFT_1137063 [Tuber borchii]
MFLFSTSKVSSEELHQGYLGVQQFLQRYLKSARDKARPDLIKVLTYKSAAAVEWLQDVFSLDLTLVSRLGGHSQPAPTGS